VDYVLPPAEMTAQIGAVKTNDVLLAVGNTAMIDRSEGTHQMPMRAVEQQIQNRVDHRFPCVSLPL
jgi:hypothetical protein